MPRVGFPCGTAALCTEMERICREVLEPDLEPDEEAGASLELSYRIRIPNSRSRDWLGGIGTTVLDSSDGCSTVQFSPVGHALVAGHA